MQTHTEAEGMNTKKIFERVERFRKQIDEALFPLSEKLQELLSDTKL